MRDWLGDCVCEDDIVSDGVLDNVAEPDVDGEPDTLVDCVDEIDFV